MFRTSACLFAAALLVTPVSSVTPVQQVVNMLEKMNHTGTEEKNNETAIFEEYLHIYNEEVDHVKAEIRLSQMLADKLSAFIDKSVTQEKTIQEKVMILDGEEHEEEVEKTDAERQREADHKEYLKANKEYSEAIDALERAIQMMKSEDYDRKQDVVAMLQQLAVASKGMRTVMAEVEAKRDAQPTQTPYGKPEQMAYEFQSDNIQVLLKDMLDKFRNERQALVVKEQQDALTSEKVVINIDELLDRQFDDEEAKKAFRAKLATGEATAKGQMDAALQICKDDNDILKGMQATLESKTAAYNNNQKVRSDELNAINEACAVMKDPKLQANYNSNVKGGTDIARHAFFFQVKSASKRAAIRNHVAATLREKAKALGSKALAAAAASVEANPFAKVVKMVEDLISKLQAEGSAEAEHHEWCQEELKKNKAKVNKKTSQFGLVQADVQRRTGEIASMAEEIAELLADQESLTKEMNEATTQRTKEHKENERTIADAQEGQQAVMKAMATLKEFYGDDEESFLQKSSPVSEYVPPQEDIIHDEDLSQEGHGVDAPEMEEYKPMGAKNGGVVGFLEVIESDFARLESETKADEAAAKQEYEKLMEESETSKKHKHEIEHKLSLKKDQAEFEKDRVVENMEAVKAEMDKAIEYKSFLKPNCLEQHNDQEERVQMRQEEIEALNQALRSLEENGKAPAEE